MTASEPNGKIELSCNMCSRRLAVSLSDCGRSVRCPCGNQLTFPDQTPGLKGLLSVTPVRGAAAPKHLSAWSEPALQKPLKERPIPTWLAPLVGPAVGAIIAFVALRKRELFGGGNLGVETIYIVVGGAAAGLVAGLVVMLLDFTRTPKTPDNI